MAYTDSATNHDEFYKRLDEFWSVNNQENIEIVLGVVFRSMFRILPFIGECGEDVSGEYAENQRLYDAKKVIVFYSTLQQMYQKLNKHHISDHFYSMGGNQAFPEFIAKQGAEKYEDAWQSNVYVQSLLSYCSQALGKTIFIRDSENGLELLRDFFRPVMQLIIHISQEVEEAFVQSVYTDMDEGRVLTIGDKNLWHSVPSKVKSIYSENFLPQIQLFQHESDSEKQYEALESIHYAYSQIVEEEFIQEDKRLKPDYVVTPETGGKKDDCLNRQNLVDSLANLLADKRNNQHLTIGLLGHWGVGKTRVIDLLKKRLKENTQERFIFGEFNAWAYEHSKNIQAGLAQEVMNGLTACHWGYDLEGKTEKQRLWMSAVNSLMEMGWNLSMRVWLALVFSYKKYTTKIVVLGIVLGLGAIFPEKITGFLSDWKDYAKTGAVGAGSVVVAGLALIPLFKQLQILLAQPFTKELLTYVKLPSYAEHLGQVTVMQEDIRLMCNIRLRSPSFNHHKLDFHLWKKRRFLFVVDDLDRCGPQGILKTFEAIRLVLDIPQVTVVIAVDQRIALAAMALHYKELEQYHELNDAKAIARDYLGKMIHLPIVLQEPESDVVQQFLGYIWGDPSGEAWPWKSALNTINKKGLIEEKTTDAEVLVDDDGEKDDDDTFPIEEIYQRIIDHPIQKRRVKKVELKKFGLNEEQKAAFAFWANFFSLSNPRQLKRLHNSYNLVRHISEVPDQPVIDDQPLSYGLIVSLLILEYMNSIESNAHRKSVKHLLYNDDLSEHISEKERQRLGQALKVIDATAIKQYKNNTPFEARRALLEFASLFVLPAIDGVK